VFLAGPGCRILSGSGSD